MKATALAHPNIALAKYWGKVPGGGNFPAVPSLSVTLSGMATRTAVEFDDALAADTLVLNGVTESGDGLARVSALLDDVRKSTKLSARARVTSDNDFPTASGLASSASGMAALALAAVHAAQADVSESFVSNLARRASASAARSIFGGYVHLGRGEPGVHVLSAKQVAPASQLPLVVLVCVTTEDRKATSSRSGMEGTARQSPFYAAWLEAAPVIHDAIEMALLRSDLEAVATLAEKSALCMHATAMAAGLVYLRDSSHAVLDAVRRMRDRGLFAACTMDAGPHVKVLVHEEKAAEVEAVLRKVPGVLRLIATKPGPGARIISEASAP